MTKQFKLNEIGRRIRTALELLDDGDRFLVRDELLEVHSLLYPGNSRSATPAENALLAKDEILSGVATRLKDALVYIGADGDVDTFTYLVHEALATIPGATINVS